MWENQKTPFALAARASKCKKRTSNIRQRTFISFPQKCKRWLAGRYRYFRGALRVEIAILRKMIFIISVTVFCQLLHNWAHNYVFYLAGKFRVYGGEKGKLVDMGFIYLPSTEDMTFSTNYMLLVIHLISVPFGLSPLFSSYMKAWTFQMIWRYCCVLSISTTLRIVCFLITILPGPAPHCSKKKRIPPKLRNIFLWLNLNNSCSDLMFSTHLMFGMLACLGFSHYTYFATNKFKRPWTKMTKLVIHSCFFACMDSSVWNSTIFCNGKSTLLNRYICFPLHSTSCLYCL